MSARGDEALGVRIITDESLDKGQTRSNGQAAAKYEHVLELARGGMGTVDVVLRKEGAFERLYARKRLLPDFIHNEEFRRMFLDEARIAGSIRHPNVVSVVDCGADSLGPFLVMEFVEGMSLSQVLKSCGAGTDLPFGLILEIGLGCSLGLAAAHAAVDCDGRPFGLIHRDLSPQNILLSWQGEVRITDFGIAKATANESRTSTGLLKGKWGYMSPEQLSFCPCDHRSDLFTLGILLFEVVTGKRLYGGAGGAKAARRILSEAPLDPRGYRPDCPEEIANLIVQLLQKNPCDRPQSADEVAERLERIRHLHGYRPGAVDAYMREHFRERRESSRQSIACALEQTRARYRVNHRGGLQPVQSLSMADLDGRADDQTVAELPEGKRSLVMSRRRAALWSWAASLLLAFLVGGLLSVPKADVAPEDINSWEQSQVSLAQPAVANPIAKQPVEAELVEIAPVEPVLSPQSMRSVLSTRQNRRANRRQIMPEVVRRAATVVEEELTEEDAPQSDGTRSEQEQATAQPSRGERPAAPASASGQPRPERTSPALVSNLNLWEWEP